MPAWIRWPWSKKMGFLDGHGIFSTLAAAELEPRTPGPLSHLWVRNRTMETVSIELDCKGMRLRAHHSSRPYF
jgi:hypothetical protein